MDDLNVQLKSEFSAAIDDDDQVNTPLRRENPLTPDPPTDCVGGVGWNSDDDGENTMPTQRVVIKKFSPRFDPNEDDATPPRTSNTTINENGENVEEAAVEDVKIKYEPPRGMDFGGLLDELDDMDLEGVINAIRSRRAEMDNMDLKPLRTEEEIVETVADGEVDDASADDEEMRLLTEEHDKILEILRRREAEKQQNPTNQETTKKRKHKKEKKHKKRRSSSPECSSRKKLRRTHKTSNSKDDDIELDYVPVRDSERSLKIISIKKLLPGDTATTAAAAGPKLSIKEKRQLAVDRVKATLKLMALERSGTPPTEYLVVDTIKKLPGRSSVLCGANFENPSPLCNNFNVSYQFNSTTPNISIAKWGLEALPRPTVALLRLTGISVNRLTQLLQHSKMPLQKLRQQEKASKGNEEDENMGTGLFRSLATQTDPNIGNRTQDVGIQAMAPGSSSSQGIFWLDSDFCETNLSQQHANVVFALKELCATMPSSTYWADSIFKGLQIALNAKRAEAKELRSRHLYSRV
ncbi:protein panoramix [Drosophila albomicans]|uniref:Protein panoramix n=1 Tax=Drosophila albomicans TaxID=7291 RepID=A0A6P8WKS5_DROAB|nr:protein panoramix [Drosophila albomicans]